MVLVVGAGKDYGEKENVKKMETTKKFSWEQGRSLINQTGALSWIVSPQN